MEREDHLIHRTLERIATAEELRELFVAARLDDGVPDRLAAAFRVERALDAALEGPRASADGAELPRRTLRPLRAAAMLSGWLVAAVLCVVAFAGLRTVPAPPSPAAPAASRPEEGTALGELPRVLLESRTAPGGGGFEVIYIRRLIEKAVVPTLYELGRDEHGEPAVVPTSGARWAAGDSL